MPKTGADRQALAAGLVARYPDDPRTHALALAILLVQQGRQDEAKDIARPVCAAPAGTKVAGAHCGERTARL